MRFLLFSLIAVVLACFTGIRTEAKSADVVLGSPTVTTQTSDIPKFLFKLPRSRVYVPVDIVIPAQPVHVEVYERTFNTPVRRLVFGKYRTKITPTGNTIYYRVE